MLRFRSLGSGSTGNATLVEATERLAGGAAGRTVRLLIDCGFGIKQLATRLATAGLTPGDLDAVFITHEHGDHIGCTHLLALKHRVPVWMSEGTWRATGERDYDGLLHFARDGATIDLGALRIDPFTVPHDAREPLQLVCSDGARRLGVLTDLGHATAHVLDCLAGVDALLLESNHCPALLAESGYPPFLQQRVGGQHGHLSNDSAAGIAAAIHHSALRHLVAAHLSRQNNRPALAQAALAVALGCAPQDVMTADAATGFAWLDA